MKFVVSTNTPDGPLSYQTASPEIALARARALAEMWRQDGTIQDMNSRAYDLDAFDTCFVTDRPAQTGRLPARRGGSYALSRSVFAATCSR